MSHQSIVTLPSHTKKPLVNKSKFLTPKLCADILLEHDFLQQCMRMEPLNKGEKPTSSICCLAIVQVVPQSLLEHMAPCTEAISRQKFSLSEFDSLQEPILSNVEIPGFLVLTFKDESVLHFSLPTLPYSGRVLMSQCPLCGASVSLCSY